VTRLDLPKGAEQLGPHNRQPGHAKKKRAAGHRRARRRYRRGLNRLLKGVLI